MPAWRDHDTADGAGDLCCENCGQRIGVYEPMVELKAGVARRTSRAAEPVLTFASGVSAFHAACYEAYEAHPLTSPSSDR